MTDTMGCDRAEELFSDYCEGGLRERLRRELETHLAGCAGCHEVLEALGEVVEALRPTEEMEPSSGLAARVAAGSWRAVAVPAPTTRHISAWGMPWKLQALAAALACVVTGAVLFTRAQGPRLTEQVSKRSVSAGVYLRERGERLIEDLRVLRVVVATAFEGRVDRVNDRVDDYRRLLERRRQTAPEHKQSSAGQGAVRSVHFRTAPGTGS